MEVRHAEAQPGSGQGSGLGWGQGSGLDSRLGSGLGWGLGSGWARGWGWGRGRAQGERDLRPVSKRPLGVSMKMEGGLNGYSFGNTILPWYLPRDRRRCSARRLAGAGRQRTPRLSVVTVAVRGFPFGRRGRP